MRGWGRGWLISTVVRLFAGRYRLSSTVGTPGNWQRGNLGGRGEAREAASIRSMIEAKLDDSIQRWKN